MSAGWVLSEGMDARKQDVSGGCKPEKKRNCSNNSSGPKPRKNVDPRLFLLKKALKTIFPPPQKNGAARPLFSSACLPYKIFGAARPIFPALFYPDFFRRCAADFIWCWSTPKKLSALRGQFSLVLVWTPAEKPRKRRFAQKKGWHLRCQKPKISRSETLFCTHAG